MKTAVTNPTTEKPATNKRHAIVFLISLAVGINYMDRVNFSIVTPTLMQEFDLTAAQMGVLQSAYFWVYVIAMIPVGALITKYGPRKIMTLAIAGWGAVTMAYAACNGFISFLVMRMALGLTEAPAFPSASRIISVWVPRKERAFSSACFDMAAKVGSGFAPPLVALILVYWGWKACFLITGAIAVLYTLVWHRCYHEPENHPTISDSELAYIRQDEVLSEDEQADVKPMKMTQLATSPMLLQICVGYGFYLYFITMLIYWLPTYFVEVRGMEILNMGFSMMVLFFLASIFELIGGKFFDRLYVKTGNLNLCRRISLGILMFGSALFLMLAYNATSMTAVVVYMCIMFILYGFGGSNIWAVPSDISPQGQSGTVGAFYSFCGNVGALVAPLVTGFMISSSYGWFGAFAVCIALTFIGGLLFVFGRYVPIKAKA